MNNQFPGEMRPDETLIGSSTVDDPEVLIEKISTQPRYQEARFGKLTIGHKNDWRYPIFAVFVG